MMSTNKAGKLMFVICIASVILEVDLRKLRLRADPTKPPRDYRPSKWLANSAMDVWYGNKTFVEILSREFKDVVDKLALRPVRASLPNCDSKSQMETYQVLNKSKESRVNVDGN